MQSIMPMLEQEKVHFKPILNLKKSTDVALFRSITTGRGQNSQKI